LNEFVNVIGALTVNDPVWKDPPVWLVDTGDGTTFGDQASLQEWDVWTKRFAAAAQPHGKIMRVYGNHDGWPGTFPLLAPGGMDAQRDMLRQNFFPETWPETPWTVAIPGTSSFIELCAVNTVDHTLVKNAFALGLAARDRHWARFPTIPPDTPANDLANKALAQAPVTGGNNLRVAVMHYPVADCATSGNPQLQKVLANRKRFARDLQTHNIVKPLVTHLLLAGHTHSPFPDIGRLPRDARAAQHNPLVAGQCQIVSGSLSQEILPGGKLKLGATWAERMVFNSPYQCSVLRFYSQPNDPNEIIMKRAIVGADDTGVFNYLPIAPKSQAVYESMTFRI